MLAHLKRAYLIALLALTVIATVILVGIILVNSGTGRWIEMAMMSAFGIGYLLLISFAAYTVIDRKFWCIPAIIGASLAAAMMVELPVYAYLEATWWTSHRGMNEWIQFLAKITGLGLTASGVLCLIPFVAAPKLNILGRTIQVLTCLSYASLFVIFQIQIWGHSTARFLEGLFASNLILTLAGTLTTFLLSRFFGIKPVNLLTTLTATIHLRCPRCLKDQDMPLQNARCIFCKLKIKIDIEEPTCPKCGYNLHNLTSSKCPECGTPLREEELPSPELFKWAQANDAQKI